MSILLDDQSRVLVQGITGAEGKFHALQCKEYGTKIVAGVTPGKGGKKVDGVPVFDSVSEAVAEKKANVALIFVPPAFASDAIIEAADAGIPLIVCITEGIPVRDMAETAAYLAIKGATLIGPNCPGLISPGKAKAGIMPGHIHKPGKIGVISRSGTLTYEAVDQLTRLDIGQSTCIGIGGDPVGGVTFTDALKLFAADADTEGVVMIGEIGGTAEEDAAAYIKASKYPKPVVSFIAGATAPPGRRMGHAGAIIMGGKGTAEAKFEALEDAGVVVVRNPALLGVTMRAVLRGEKVPKSAPPSSGGAKKKGGKNGR